jgi:hypothetical protein
MHATLRCAAPAVLLALAAGCGQDASVSKKGPDTMPPKDGGQPAVARVNEVTLKVEGMT